MERWPELPINYIREVWNPAHCNGNKTVAHLVLSYYKKHCDANWLKDLVFTTFDQNLVEFMTLQLELKDIWKLF